MAALGLLPDAHVHAHDDDTVVHRHVIAGGADQQDEDSDHEDVDRHHTSLDHDGHLQAHMLSVAYEVSVSFSMTASPAVTTRADAGTDPPIAHQPDRARLLPTHDPPLRFSSSPAPPVSA